MSKPILISGIQPSGKLHIGNYLGALKNFVDLQNSEKYNCYFFIADYHSLTEDYNPKEKPAQVRELMTDYLSAGLTPAKSTLFVQSDVPESTELAWILSTLAPLGELNRMTQFKEKSGRGESVNIGLFTYPVLMAADITLYDASLVPVGDDQLQHLEFTRTIVRRFNTKFGKLLTEPKPLLTNLPRVMSLVNPHKKMSKSEPAGCLFLNDSPEVIKEKVLRAVTDSGSEVKFDEKAKAGISNLIKILGTLKNESVSEVEKKFHGKNYSEFKKLLSSVIIDTIKPFQKKKADLKKKPAVVDFAFVLGAKKAKTIAVKKLGRIKKTVGL